MIPFLDISYTVLTDAQAERLKAAGWRGIMCCLWTAREVPRPTLDNLRVASAHGLMVGGYISVNGSMPGAWHVENGHAAAGDMWERLVHVPIDVELKGIPNSTVREAVEKVASFGKHRAIYTSQSCWTENQGNSQQFADCLLWNALWTGQPVLRPVTYGAWKGVLGQQWSGGAYVEGVYADRNIFQEEYFEEEEMPLPFKFFTKPQQAAIANVRLQLAQPAPLTTGVTAQVWEESWQRFFVGYNVPEAERVVPPQPKIAQGAGGDFTINVVRGYVTEAGKITWLW